MNTIFLNRVAGRLRRDFASVLGQMALNTQEVILHVDLATPGAAYDRNVASTYPAPQPATRTFRALVHFISDQSRLYGFQGFEVGDVLLFFRPEENVTGSDPWFEIQGAAYVQKDTGTLLAQDWSLQVGGQLIHRAMLLTRKRGQEVAGPQVGFVDYVAAGERISLYGYGNARGFFGTPQLDEAKGLIADGADGLEFYIGGVLAMRAQAGVLHIHDLQNGPAPSSGMRLEFRIDGRLVAVLMADGTLIVPAIFNAASEPSETRDFDLRTSGAWVASLGLAGSTAASYDATL